MESESLYMGKSEIFLDLDCELHGITFDNLGNMYVGKEGKNILKITPDGNVKNFVTLDDTFNNAEIWNITMGIDGNIYAAAKSRVLKITMDGIVSTLIEGDFAGNWGICDVKFDKSGNMYAAHDNKVSKFTQGLEKTDFIDGTLEDVKIMTAVGIEFDKNCENIYVGDCMGMKVLKYPVNADGTHTAPQIFDIIPFAQYIVADEDDNAFISVPGPNFLAKVCKDGSKEVLWCDNQLMFPQTLSFGKMGFDENSIYIVNKGKIVKVYIGSKA